jgi:hypothetical protein
LLWQAVVEAVVAPAAHITPATVVQVDIYLVL